MRKSDVTLKTPPATFERLGVFHFALRISHFAFRISVNAYPMS